MQFEGGAGERVGALVLRMAGVAAHPVPGDLVRRACRFQALPEVDVFHRLLGGRLPAPALPVVHPAGDAVAQVGAVGGERDPRGPFQRLEGGDRFGRQAILDGDETAWSRLSEQELDELDRGAYQLLWKMRRAYRRSSPVEAASPPPVVEEGFEIFEELGPEVEVESQRRLRRRRAGR